MRKFFEIRIFFSSVIKVWCQCCFKSNNTFVLKCPVCHHYFPFASKSSEKINENVILSNFWYTCILKKFSK